MALDVLIIDESPLCRDLLVSVLCAQGYSTAWVTPAEAQATISQASSAVVVLDPGPHGSEGWTLLDLLLADRHTAHAPGIVILTDQSGKTEVLRAAQAGVRDYMLKQRFSLPEFLTRVRRHAAPSGSGFSQHAAETPGDSTFRPAVSTTVSVLPGAHQPALVERLPVAVNSAASNFAAVATEIGLPLQSAKLTLERLDAASLKTLPGAVAEVMAMASSTRASIADLAQILLRDPVLTAGILRVANTAAFISPRGRVATVEDAVKTIGVSGVRNLVVNVGIFNAFASDNSGGLWVPRVWQHCIGVAMLMEKLAPRHESVPAGSAYLVGLCHDLPEIILRQKFADLCASAEKLVIAAGCTYREAFKTIFGLPYAEFVSQLLSRLRLPPLITVPIEEFFDRGDRRAPTGSGSLLGRTLRAVNCHAHGLLLAPSHEDFVTPLTRAECTNTFGIADPPAADDQMIRAHAIATAAALAGLSTSQTEQLCEPMVARHPLRICYSRHGDFSTLDPLAAFLKLTAKDVQVFQGLDEIDASALDRADVLVVAGGSKSATDGSNPELDRIRHLIAGRALRVLYLKGRTAPQASIDNIATNRLPISIRALSTFLGSASEQLRGIGPVEPQHAAA